MWISEFSPQGHLCLFNPQTELTESLGLHVICLDWLYLKKKEQKIRFFWVSLHVVGCQNTIPLIWSQNNAGNSLFSGSFLRKVDIPLVIALSITTKVFVGDSSGPSISNFPLSIWISAISLEFDSNECFHFKCNRISISVKIRVSLFYLHQIFPQ